MQLTYPTEFPRYTTFGDHTRCRVESLEQYNILCGVHGEPHQYAILKAVIDSTNDVDKVVDETKAIVEEAVALIRTNKGKKNAKNRT